MGGRMTVLTNTEIGSTYGDVITTTNNGQGLTNVLQNVQDGLGNNSTIQIATNAVNFNRTVGNSFQLDSVALTAPANNLNLMASAPGATGFYVTSGTLTSNQILNLTVTTPVAINSPGAGNAIIVHKMMMNYIYGGIAYSNGGDILLGYNPGGGLPFVITAGDSTITGLTNNTYFNLFGLSDIQNSNKAINTSIIITNIGGAYTAGNGTINYAIWYSIVAMQ